jgi:hypothetical protein
MEERLVQEAELSDPADSETTKEALPLASKFASFRFTQPCGLRQALRSTQYLLMLPCVAAAFYWF